MTFCEKDTVVLPLSRRHILIHLLTYKYSYVSKYTRLSFSCMEYIDKKTHLFVKPKPFCGRVHGKHSEKGPNPTFLQILTEKKNTHYACLMWIFVQNFHQGPFKFFVICDKIFTCTKTLWEY